MTESSVVQVERGKFINSASVNRIDIELVQSRYEVSLDITLYNNSGFITVMYPIVSAEYAYEIYKPRGIEDKIGIPDLSIPFREIAEQSMKRDMERECVHQFRIDKGMKFLRTVDLTIIFTIVSDFLATQTLEFPESTTLFMYLFDKFDNHDDSHAWLMNTIKGYVEAIKPIGETNGEH